MAAELSQGKTAMLVEAFDLNRMAAQSLDGQKVDDKVQRDLLGGMRIGLASSFGQFKGGHVKLMRAGNENGIPCCLFRVLTDEGAMTYLELEVDPDSKPNFKIVDMENPVMGGKFSDRIASALVVALKDSDASLVDRIFRRKSSADANASKKLLRFYSLLSQGKFPEIDAAYKNLAETDRGTWSVACAWVLSARAAGEETYRQALAEVAGRFGNDPVAQFVLIDHYAYQGDWKSIVKSLDLISKRFGPDGHLESVRATILQRDGRLDEAVAASRKAVELEPDLPEVWDISAISAVQAQDFARAVECFTRFEKESGSQIEVARLREAGPEFARFLDSPEGKAWLEKRRK